MREKGSAMRIFSSLILVLSVTSVVWGQRQERKPSDGYVVVPSENVLLVIAAQTAVPIRFENTKLLMSVDGRDLAVSYTLRNISQKPIRYLTAVMWTSFATGGSLADSQITSGMVNNSLLMPGQTLEHQSEGTVQLTDTLRDKLKFTGSLKAIVVLMAQRVTFADGTVYDDNATSRALLSYFERVSDNMESRKNCPDR